MYLFNKCWWSESLWNEYTEKGVTADFFPLGHNKLSCFLNFCHNSVISFFLVENSYP